MSRQYDGAVFEGEEGVVDAVYGTDDGKSAPPPKPWRRNAVVWVGLAVIWWGGCERSKWRRAETSAEYWMGRYEAEFEKRMVVCSEIREAGLPPNSVSYC